MTLLTKYHNTVLFAGNPVPDVEVTVTLALTATLASLFVDRDGVTPLANPFLTSSPFGLLDFYAGPGRYSLAFAKPSYTFPSILDVTIGVIGALEEQTVDVPLVASAGATFLLAAGIRPAGSRLLKVTSLVTTAFGTSGGLTGFTIGDSGGPDRWGVSTALTLGATTDYAQMRDDALPIAQVDTDMQVFPVGGDFDNTGALTLTLHYLT